jgi:hypothetical protein
MPELLLTAKKNLTDFRYSVLVQETTIDYVEFFHGADDGVVE